MFMNLGLFSKWLGCEKVEEDIKYLTKKQDKVKYYILYLHCGITPFTPDYLITYKMLRLIRDGSSIQIDNIV